MQLSLALLTLSLAAFVRADEADKKVDTDYDDVPAELTKTVDNKVEFCQNYLGWVKKETTTVFDYYTKTKTDYKWDVSTKPVTISKGVTTITAPKVTIWKTYTKTPHPYITTKTYTETKWKKGIKWDTKTITLKGKGKKHHKRGGDYDFKKGPDVGKWQRYHVSKACYKILKKVEPKTRTYTVTVTDKKATYTTTTLTKTKTKYDHVYVPKYTSTVTPTVKKVTHVYAPKATITKKAYTKVYSTKYKTYTKTVYVTKKGNKWHHHDHKGGKDGKY